MVVKMRMSFLVALVSIVSLVLVGPVNAQDEPCEIHPDSLGIMVDSIQITDQAGYTRTMWRGWDPSYTVTEFGPWEPIVVITNYTITDSDPVPLNIKAVFKAFGEERVIENKKHASGSYSVIEMFFPVGQAAGTHKIKCILKVKHRGELVGWSKALCSVTTSD